MLRSGCGACHNNTNAVGKSASHMTTQRDCSTCHSYPDWSVINFKHPSAAWPGDHRVTLGCVACHASNSDQIPYAFAAGAATCSGCHAKNFKADAHPKTSKGETYSAGELANCTGACHVYSDSSRTTVVKSVPAPYHRVTDATFKR